MQKGGIGGGHTITGLQFEGKVDLATFLSSQEKYKVMENGDVIYKNQQIAKVLKGHNFYKFLLEEFGINWNEHISRQLLPDDSIYVVTNNTIYIIECKFQQVEGSVDEKLQTCDFKKKQYQKLLSKTGIKVEYIYLLDDWFKQDKYRDTLNYIKEVGCDYYFNQIPLKKLGLPE